MSTSLEAADSDTMDMSLLFQPLEVGDVTIPNRIGMSAMSRNRADPKRMPSHLMKKYYLQRALGGAGLIISEATLISPHGAQFDRCPGIWNSEQVAAWKKITNVVHLAGSKMYCQLWHLGRLSHPDPNGMVYSPSAIQASGEKYCFHYLLGELDFVVPSAIEDPFVLVKQFKDAAVNAKAAGFDGVEIHGAAGFLVHQFLDTSANIRTDEWGGSPEKRTRFALEVLKACKEVFGINVSLKISPAGGFNDSGMPLQETLDTYRHLVAEVDKLGLSYISLYRHNAHKDPIVDGKRRGTPHDLVASYGPYIKQSKIFVVGGVTPMEAAELIRTEQVAGVFFGMPWLSHPDLAKRIKHGKNLDNLVAMPFLYGDTQAGVDPRVGYTDYPSVTY
ncbi:Oxidored-FMN domain-containing protein [Mycena indigotica]|uniref:Oxidored-FMN domain-containing protein n=1 Tax=Mycena indigotica TaxID=2126181 RepID=A0A8H6W916_9AGAR|nr:Oxidored-FMN domain-containing protein [Mycena indigotica]KAF7303684.1 Oxidored-FMN domain-containing protein [Mycena indigotica]